MANVTREPEETHESFIELVRRSQQTYAGAVLTNPTLTRREVLMEEAVRMQLECLWDIREGLQNITGIGDFNAGYVRAVLTSD